MPAYAAVAGSMLVLVVPIVGPDSGGFMVALTLITGMVLGGARTVSGAVVGAVAVVFLPYYSKDWAASLPFLSEGEGAIFSTALYGVILVAFVFLMPGGIMSFVRSARLRLIRFVPSLPPAQAPASASSEQEAAEAVPVR